RPVRPRVHAAPRRPDGGDRLQALAHPARDLRGGHRPRRGPPADPGQRAGAGPGQRPGARPRLTAVTPFRPRSRPSAWSADRPFELIASIIGCLASPGHALLCPPPAPSPPGPPRARGPGRGGRTIRARGARMRLTDLQEETEATFGARDRARG